MKLASITLNPFLQCELWTAEKEAAAKIQAQTRTFTAKKQLRREVHNAAFNALDNHDENVRVSCNSPRAEPLL